MNTKTYITVLLVLTVIHTQITVPGNSCCKDNQIQVSGQGKASALPDMAVVRIRFSEKGKTSAEAVKALSQKVNQALSTLKANGYGSDSVQTGSINVYPEYNYLNGRSEIVGQVASQSLTIRARGVDAKGQKIGVLVDALAQIDGLNLDSVSFDIYDKTKLQSQARAQAYKDAKQKAQDYASFAGLTLGRVLTVDDTYTVQAPPIRPNAFGGVAMASFAAKQSSTSVPLGDLDVNYRTTITYQLR